MTGKTHMAAGIVASVALTLPEEPRAMLVCVASAAIGSVISDIDVSTSEARREFNKLLGVVVLILAAVIFLEYRFGFGIFRAVSEHGYLRSLAGFFALLAVCIFGKSQPHRSFTHSFLGLAVFTGSVYLLFPAAAVPFAAAFMSHILLDLLNKRKLRLFYPFRKGAAFCLCRADGFMNGLLFYVGITGSIVLVGEMLLSYIFSSSS